MQSGHGDADRLIAPGQDFQKFDEAMASAAEGEGMSAEAARTILSNHFTGPGRFGKMFPNLNPFRPADDEGLIELGDQMKETRPTDTTLDNSEIPAGFTYLGQFIDHDITRDPTADFPPITDPATIENARTPTLDLDSLYLNGPEANPELYEPDVDPSRAVFKIGSTVFSPASPNIPGGLPNDLPRGDDKKAIIGDDRNDENLLVAQTHLAFLKFHNKLMETLPQGDDGGSDATTFDKARRLVTWHYQWIVLNDFLSEVLDPDILADIRSNGRQFYSFTGRPFMPIEFSVAAYRLGHSMVREVYNHNRVFSDEPGALTPATLFLLFQFTGSGGLGGQATLPTNWVIDWRRFHEVDDSGLLNHTRRLDTKLGPMLHTLPGTTPNQPPSLAVRNLLRGSRVGLPTGQAVAQEIGATVLTSAEIASGDDGEVLRQHGFDENTPLWYYVLKEADLQRDGKRLGEVGSRIVGEVFVGLLEGDPNSFLSRQPDWVPTLPSATPGDFTMADLLTFVDDVNPIERFFVPDPLPVSGTMSVYTVQAEDTMSGIADAFGTSVEAIAQANSIPDVNLIFEGQVLCVPDSPDVPVPSVQSYTVQAGDTLNGIAEAFGTTVEDIAQINGIEDPDLIFEGQVLCVPLSSGAPPLVEHTVRPGDTLSGLAEAFGTTVETIAQINQIPNPDFIFVGQRLLIPQV